MKTLILLMIMVLLIGGCASGTQPPGHAVASENHFENGMKQYEKGHIKQAIHQFEMAIEKNPRNFIAYFYLGLCYKRQEKIKTAHKHFQKAIDLNPDDESWVAKVKEEMKITTAGKEKKK